MGGLSFACGHGMSAVRGMMNAMDAQHPITQDEAQRVLAWHQELGYAYAALYGANRGPRRGRARRVDEAQRRVQRAQDAIRWWDERVAAGVAAAVAGPETNPGIDPQTALDACWREYQAGHEQIQAGERAGNVAATVAGARRARYALAAINAWDAVVARDAERRRVAAEATSRADADWLNAQGIDG